MAVLGVLFGVVLSIGALVLPFVASWAAKGARTRTRAALELVKQRAGRIEALERETLQLRTELRKLLHAAHRAQAGR